MKNLKKIVTLLLIIVSLFAFVACNESDVKENPQNTENVNVADGIKKEGLWAAATYTEDTSFGEGAKTLKVKVEADGQSIMFTVKTDKKPLARRFLSILLLREMKAIMGFTLKL